MERAEPGAPGLLQVEVIYCAGPGLDDSVPLALHPGATVLDALRASGLLQRHRLDVAALQLGVWGTPRTPGTLLRERDRVEIYRPLAVDPKAARRLRQQRHRGG